MAIGAITELPGVISDVLTAIMEPYNVTSDSLLTPLASPEQ